MTVLRQRLLSTNNTNNSTTTNTNNESSPPPPLNPDPNPNPLAHRNLALANVRTYTVTVQNLIDSLAVANRCDVAVAGVGMAQCNLRSAWAYCAATLTAQVSAC